MGIKTLLMIFIIFIFCSVGCYQRLWYRTNEINFQPDKNSLIDYKYYLNIIEYPSHNKPYLNFEIVRYPIYRNFKVVKYIETEKISHKNTSLVLSVLSFIGNLIIYSIEAEKEDFTKPSYAFYGSLIPTGIFVLYFMISANLDEGTQPKFTKNYKFSYEKDTSSVIDSVKSTFHPYNFTVKLKLDNKERIYTCMENCSLKIIDDFGLLNFDTLVYIKTHLSVLLNSGITIDTIIQLDPKRWTREYIKILQDSVPTFYVTKENELEVIKYLRKDEFYEIFYKGDELDEIICDSVITKVEKGVGKYVWLKK